jgi:hypothetical protein
MKTYTLRFMSGGRVESAQMFQADDDAAALTFMDMRRRGRAARLSGTGGLIRACGPDPLTAGA